MTEAAPKKRGSPKTARSFLLTLVQSLRPEVVEDFQVAQDTAIATVVTPSGDRYNIHIHKLAGEYTGNVGPKPLPETRR